MNEIRVDVASVRPLGKGFPTLNIQETVVSCSNKLMFVLEKGAVLHQQSKLRRQFRGESEHGSLWRHQSGSGKTKR